MRDYHRDVLMLLRGQSAQMTIGVIRRNANSRSLASIRNSVRWLRSKDLIETNGEHGRNTRWMITQKGREALAMMTT